MVRTIGIVWLIALAGTLGVAQESAEQLGTRLRAAVTAYEQVVKELDLGRLPTDAPDYRLVADNVQELGERLETASRLALQTERAAQPDWAHLADAVAALENDLRQLRRQSLTLRVWSSEYRQGRKKPVWGFAVSRAQEPLPTEQGSFDAETVETLELTLKPGEQQMVQVIVVPLGSAVRRMRATPETLKGDSGKIAASAMSLLPVDYSRLGDPASAEPWWRRAVAAGTPDVAADGSQAFVLVVAVPAEAKPGQYLGSLRFNPEGTRHGELDVCLTVPG